MKRWTGWAPDCRMGRWSPPRLQCSRATSDRRDRVTWRCVGRDAGGVPPARRPRYRAVFRPPASAGGRGGRPDHACQGYLRPGQALGVAVTVWDDAVVRWLAGLRLPGLTGLMETIVASTGSVGMVGALRWATVIALLALRRSAASCSCSWARSWRSCWWSGWRRWTAHGRTGWTCAAAGPAGRCRRGRSPSSPPP